MQRMLFKGQQPYLLCTRKGCCAAAKFELVESRILNHLRDTLEKIELEQPDHQRDLAPLEDAVTAISKELTTANRQKARLHELLEMGEYDLPTYAVLTRPKPMSPLCRRKTSVPSWMPTSPATPPTETPSSTP